ncbi:MAG TPA: hypothetical protein VNN22_19455 [Verrucomicrobiae bacterium]|nr:hypothetical protein [Verrucomicrobiae bacterium]
MKKIELNNLLREYVKANLSPTQNEQNLVSSLYDAFKTALDHNTILIGSYARFTASRPLHDLDILYVSGKFDPTNLNPANILSNLEKVIQAKFKNPTTLQTKISPQTHSITVAFLENGTEKFAVDIVPAFTSGLKNEFNEDIYWVPEIVKTSRRNRRSRYEALAKTKKTELEWWIKSDPRGYIKATADLNAQNGDFRKTTKFIKRWKHNCKMKQDGFKLKSFHIEQVIFAIYKQHPVVDIAGAIFKFFCDIPKIIARPQIKDRADEDKFIDDYLSSLTEVQKKQIIQARDFFLIKLENISENPSIPELLAAGFHNRASTTEEYLFDSGIPVLLEKGVNFKINGRALPRDGGFREKFLDMFGGIEVDRKIDFYITGDKPTVDLFKWKVKNANSSPQPRGEITNHSTLHNPEHTKYDGSHFVECFAIKDGICIARAKQDVVLQSFYKNHS